jgi:hypothetical protein
MKLIFCSINFLAGIIPFLFPMEIKGGGNSTPRSWAIFSVMLLFSMTVLSIKIAANESASDLLDHPLPCNFSISFSLGISRTFTDGKGISSRELTVICRILKQAAHWYQ